jgi:predicted PhzF superfamily epimerase YddE/YHI9
VTARFHTRSGLLTAAREGNRIVLDFPATPAIEMQPPQELLPALGVSNARWTGRNRFDYLVELAAESQVRALQPDHSILAQLGVRGVIVTSRADQGRPYDFVSRFFAPGAGIPEDPVTGSAHCTLAAHWRPTFGRDRMIGHQASARGGTVYVECAGERILLAGQAVTVMTGVLR